MPRYRSGYSRPTVSSRTGAISENAVVFSASGGHSHDGSNSSLIDTLKYSIWDFPVNTVYTTTPRATKQAGHIEQFKSFVADIVNTSVLEPAGVVLGDNVVNANNIIAGSISSELIAANTIVANNIAANTITTELLATDAITSLNYSYSSGNYSNSGTFFDLSDGSITSEQFYIDNAGNAGFKGSINLGTYNYWNSNGTFSVGNASQSMTWNGSSLSLTGNISLNSYNYWNANGTFSVGSSSERMTWNGSSLSITGDISLGSYNYWINGGDFRVGGSSEYLFWDQSAARVRIRGDIELGTYNYWTYGGDFRVGGSAEYMFWDQSAGTLRVSGDIILDSNNYWYRGSDFRIGNSTKYVFWDQSAGTLNVRGNIYAESGTFTGSISSSATISGGEFAGGVFSLSSGSSVRIRFGTSYGTGIDVDGGPYGDMYIGLGVVGFEGNYYNVPTGSGYANAGHFFSGRVSIVRSTHYSGDWSRQQLSISSSGNAGMAIRAGTDAGTIQFRMGYNFPTLFVRNHNDSAYSPIAAGDIGVNGNLNVTGTKNFAIPHPVIEDKRLRHAAVESPTVDLQYRGKAVLKNGATEVCIDEASGMTDGTFVAICREPVSFVSNNTGWSGVKSRVIGNILYIESDDKNCNDEVSWIVIGERCDDNMINSDITDATGKLIVEYDQTNFGVD